MKSIYTFLAALFISLPSFAVVGPIVGPTVICAPSSAAYTDTTAGGTWSLTNTTVATISTGGILTPITTGYDTVIYTVGGSSQVLMIWIYNTPPAISGPTSVCLGGTATLADAATGGTWSSSAMSVATISAGAIVTGLALGSTTITYALSSGCLTTHPMTVISTVAPITGASSVCDSSLIALSDATTGGTWISSDSAIASVGASTGFVTGVSAGTATISYLVGSCGVTKLITVNPIPSITTNFAVGTCNGGIDTLTATGATSYNWSPSTGLSCATCATTLVSASSSTTYTVYGTTGGCSAVANITVNEDRISGHITFSSTPPTSLGMKVWLIQYSSIDSSLTALDSQLTCLDGGVTPYYEFTGKPAGNYIVKAKLLSSIPGTSDYIPTYGYSNTHWDSATTVTHTATTTDSLHINMLYGTVPSGPGFIGGLIVMGAGKGTSGEVPAPNMLVYLENATTHQVLTYNYTNNAGAFSFSNLALGSYIIYPVDYHYATTPSATLTLTATADSVTVADFKEHTTLRTITPFVISTGVTNISGNAAVSVYPNPSMGLLNIEFGNAQSGNSTVVISDVIGRNVFSQEISGTQVYNNINISSLKDGIYLITVKGNGLNYSGKLEVRH